MLLGKVLIAGRRARPSRACRIPDDAAIECVPGILTAGAAARVFEHSDGRSLATELVTAPAVLQDDLEGGRWLALGTSSFASFDPRAFEAQNSLDALVAEQARLQRVWRETILFEPARARVAHLLLLLASAYPDAGPLPVRLSYRRIASLCGVTERSIDRCVADWIKAGTVERTKHGYRAVDRHALGLCLGTAASDLDFCGSAARRRTIIDDAAQAPWAAPSSAFLA